MKPKKSDQKQITVPLGNDQVGLERKRRWLDAAVTVMRDPKLFNAWIRRVLDQEAERILNS